MTEAERTKYDQTRRQAAHVAEAVRCGSRLSLRPTTPVLPAAMTRPHPHALPCAYWEVPPPPPPPPQQQQQPPPQPQPQPPQQPQPQQQQQPQPQYFQNEAEEAQELADLGLQWVGGRLVGGPAALERVDEVAIAVYRMRYESEVELRCPGAVVQFERSRHGSHQILYNIQWEEVG